MTTATIDATKTSERYVLEWLNAQAAGDYVTFDPDMGRYTFNLVSEAKR